MWLPSSSFNRPTHFETTSKYGRKRRHKVEPEENLEPPLCAKRKKDTTSDTEEQTEKHISTKKNQVSGKKRATKMKKKCRNKGKAFHSTLPLSLDLR